MIKNRIILLFLILCSINATSQIQHFESYYISKFYDIMGVEFSGYSIKKMEITEYSGKKEKFRIITNFDELGRKTNEETLRMNGRRKNYKEYLHGDGFVEERSYIYKKKFLKRKYFYEDMKLLKVINYFYDDNEKAERISVFTYDSLNRLIDMYDGLKNRNIRKIKYNDEGQIVVNMFQVSIDTLIYLDNGLLKEIKSYGMDEYLRGNLTEPYESGVYEYDERERLVKLIWLYNDAKVPSKKTYSFSYIADSDLLFSDTYEEYVYFYGYNGDLLTHRTQMKNGKIKRQRVIKYEFY